MTACTCIELRSGLSLLADDGVARTLRNSIPSGVVPPWTTQAEQISASSTKLISFQAIDPSLPEFEVPFPLWLLCAVVSRTLCLVELVSSWLACGHPGDSAGFLACTGFNPSPTRAKNRPALERRGGAHLTVKYRFWWIRRQRESGHKHFAGLNPGAECLRAA